MRAPVSLDTQMRSTSGALASSRGGACAILRSSATSRWSIRGIHQARRHILRSHGGHEGHKKDKDLADRLLTGASTISSQTDCSSMMSIISFEISIYICDDNDRRSARAALQCIAAGATSSRQFSRYSCVYAAPTWSEVISLLRKRREESERNSEGAGEVVPTAPGQVFLVGTGPGDPSLLTLV